MKLNEFITESRKAHKVMRADLEKSALSVENSQKVLEVRILSDMTSEEGFSFHGHGTLEAGEDGLKLTCPNRLQEFPLKPPSGPRGRREAPQRESNYGRSTITYAVGGEDWSGYDRITFRTLPDCRGYQSVWLELTLVSGDNETQKRINLQNGVWNTVNWIFDWEFDDVERTNVSAFTISYILQGAQMNMADRAVFRFNRFALEKTEPTVSVPVKVELTTQTLKSLAWKTLNFYYSQRCGYDIPTVHLPCHEDCFAAHPDGRLAPIGGGWHSEGYRHSLFDTARSASALIELAEKVREDEALCLRLTEEARVGLEWMLRTRFADGYRCVDAPIDVYTKGIIGDSDDLKLPAHNDAYANFVSAQTEAMAAIAYRSLDATFAGYAGRCAEADFAFACERMNLKGRQFGKFSPDYPTGASASHAAWALYRATGKQAYLDQAIAFAHSDLENGLYIDLLEVLPEHDRLCQLEKLEKLGESLKAPESEEGDLSHRIGLAHTACRIGKALGDESLTEVAKAYLRTLLGDNPSGISEMVGEGKKWITPFSYFGADIVGSLGEAPSIGLSADLIALIAELI